MILKLHFQLKCPIFNKMCSSHDGTMFQNDSRCSFTMSLAQGDYCKQKKLDPQDPICAQVTLVGRMERVSCVVPPSTHKFRNLFCITLIPPRSLTGMVWFYTSTSNKRAARPKLYTKSLTRDLKLMYSRLTLVRISIKL